MLRDNISNDFFIILLVASLVVIALAKITSPKRFNDFIMVLGNSKYLKIYSREQKFFDKFDEAWDLVMRNLAAQLERCLSC